jgi:hypothetical protein
MGGPCGDALLLPAAVYDALGATASMISNIDLVGAS